jgi:hypothetical protein
MRDVGEELRPVDRRQGLAQAHQHRHAFVGKA